MEKSGNLYKELEIGKTATGEEIRSKYRELALV